MTAKRKPEQPNAQIVQGHVLDVLAGMEAESVSCCVTSPPYWSQRKYDAPDVTWPDGWCGQLGLEPTVELYVEHTVEWLRAVHRVLRPDGVCWVNLGDGYASNPAKGGSGAGGKEETWHGGAYDRRSRGGLGTLKEKDLVLMPFRVALAAQADGWWVRSVIIWSKPNAMPESVRDRPTQSHEYLLLLTKNPTYWYDQEAVREAISQSSIDRISQPTFDQQTGGDKDYGKGTNPNRSARRAVENLKEKWSRSGQSRTTDGLHEGRWDQYINSAGRNMRSVWTFPTAQSKDAHFAVFPEEMPRRIILASCPQYFCPRCGIPGPDTRRGGAALRERYWRRYHGGKTEAGITLDPFAGVGTAGVVARRLGRRFVGIELSKKYCRMAAKRMEQTTLGIPL